MGDCTREYNQKMDEINNSLKEEGPNFTDNRAYTLYNLSNIKLVTDVCRANRASNASKKITTIIAAKKK